MRRGLAAAAVLVTFGVAVPDASACTLPAPRLFVDRERIVAGSDVGVRGEVYSGGCPELTSAPLPPSETPSETPPATPSETASATASATPSETPPTTATPSTTSQAFAIRAAAFRPPYQAAPTSIVIQVTPGTGPSFGLPDSAWQSIDTLPATALTTVSEGLQRFTGTVTVPASLAPGTYQTRARHGTLTFYGPEITVLAALPETGGTTGGLARAGLLALLAGAATLAAGHGLARRGRT